MAQGADKLSPGGDSRSAGELGRVRLGISACLLGERVRYDGGHKLDRYLADTLGRHIGWVPLCPEAEAGLGTPREAMRLLGVDGPDFGNIRLVARKSGDDHTATLQKWTRRRLRRFARGKSSGRDDVSGKSGGKRSDVRLCGFVFKSRSPSCSIPAGIFASAFIDAFPDTPVEDERRLRDPACRENFIERVFVMDRWHELTGRRVSLGRLNDFHSDHKFLVMAHSPAHLRQLELLMAEGRERGPAATYAEYLPLMMEGLRLRATLRKNVNVLGHMLEYLGKFLERGEERELRRVIDSYHRGLVPLLVPLTLMRHYARRYDESFLARQYYLNPAPAELMLRNRV